MSWLKQSTAASCIIGPILDSTGAEYASAVIGDLSISKNGGTLTALASAATLTFIANGMYTLALTTGNTDTVGRVEISCNKATYQMPQKNMLVLLASVFDALITNAANATGGLIAATAAVSAAAGYIGSIGAAVNGTNANTLSSHDPGSTIMPASSYSAPPSAASIRAEVDSNSTQLAAIVADTNELQTDWVNGGRLDNILDARASQTSVDDLPTNAELSTALGTSDDAMLAAIAALNDVTAAEVATAVEAAILDEGDATALLAAIAAKVETFVINDGDASATLAAIGTAVRTNLATELARIDVATSTRLATAGYTAPPTAATNATAVRTELTTELARIDVATSTRLASGSYTAPDNSTIGTINTKLGTPAASVSADIAAVKTDTGNLVTRITSTLFSGITSLAQWLGLMTGKQVGDSTSRTELRATGAGSGTFDETTGSLEAIGDKAIPTVESIDTQLSGTHGAGQWSHTSGGTGARTVTITVDDGTDPLENANVRVTQGAESYVLETDVDGLAVFALDDATWAVAIAKPLFAFAPTTLVVDGDEAETYSMTSVAITPSASERTTCYLTLQTLAGVAAPGIDVTFEYIKFTQGAAGEGVSVPHGTQATNAAGYVEWVNIHRLAKYRVRIGDDGQWIEGRTLDAATTPLINVSGSIEA